MRLWHKMEERKLNWKLLRTSWRERDFLVFFLIIKKWPLTERRNINALLLLYPGTRLVAHPLTKASESLRLFASQLNHFLSCTHAHYLSTFRVFLPFYYNIHFHIFFFVLYYLMPILSQSILTNGPIRTFPHNA